MPRPLAATPSYTRLRSHTDSLFSHTKSARSTRRSVSYTTRPSIAAKPSLDIKHIAKNPGLYSQNCVDRNYAQHKDDSWKILELTEKRTQLRKAVTGVRQRNNGAEREIQKRRHGLQKDEIQALDEGPEVAGLLNLLKELKVEVSAAAEQEKDIEAQLNELALGLPNLSSVHTPNGEAFEVVETVESTEGTLNTASKSHVDIGAELDLLDFTSAATTSGWGWYYLKNEAALLEQALVQYALSVLLKRGWQVISPPSIVYSHIAAACGFQPRDQNGEQQIYALQQADKDAAKPPLSLAATAEIPLAGMNAGRSIDEAELPLKTVAVSRCYRAEAGGRGVETKGLYRVHEFTKVEMFAWTLPDDSGPDNLGADTAAHSTDVWREMLAVQREILTALGLTFRVLEMPSADLGASASRKQDMEALFPSRIAAKNDGWGEVTSASICTDYQSRRLATRVRKRSQELIWPHTVNGTALAVPRVLAAILEMGWNDDDKTVTIPKALRPWMGGQDVIRKRGGEV